MKKLLVLLVSAALVLSLAAVTMAAATVTGAAMAKYQMNNDISDQFEAAITAAGPVSDSVVGSITFKSDGDISTNNFFVDAWTFKATYDWGTWTVGKWGFAAKGPVLDVLSPVYGDFKGTAAMAFEKKFDSGLNIGLWVSPDEDTVAEDIGDGAYVATIGYTTDAFLVSAFLIDCGEGQDPKDGYALNFVFTGIENLSLYVNYEDNDVVNQTSLIAGAKYVAGSFYAMAEMNFDDDYEEDYYGFRLNYAFANGIFAQYRYVSDTDDLGDEEDTNELRLGVAF